MVNKVLKRAIRKNAIRTFTWAEKGAHYTFNSAMLEPLTNAVDAVFKCKLLKPKGTHYVNAFIKEIEKQWTFIVEDTAPVDDGVDALIRILNVGDSTHNARNGEKGVGNKGCLSYMWSEDGGNYDIYIRGKQGMFRASSPFTEDLVYDELAEWPFDDDIYFHQETRISREAMDSINCPYKEGEVVTDEQRVEAIAQNMRLWMTATILIDKIDVYFNSDKPIEPVVPGHSLGLHSIPKLPFNKNGYHIDYILDGSGDNWAKSTGLSGVYFWVNGRYVYHDSDFYKTEAKVGKDGEQFTVTHNSTNELVQFVFLYTANDDGTADMQHTLSLVANKKGVVSWTGINKKFKDAITEAIRKEFDKRYHVEARYRAPLDTIFEKVAQLKGCNYVKEVKLYEGYGDGTSKAAKSRIPDAIVFDAATPLIGKGKKHCLNASIVGDAQSPNVLSIVEYKPETIDKDAIYQMHNYITMFEAKYGYIPCKSYIICPATNEEADITYKKLKLESEYNVEIVKIAFVPTT